MIKYDVEKAAQFLDGKNVKIVREFVADRDSNNRLLVLHYTRTTGTVSTQAALLYPNHAIGLMKLDMFRSVVANIEEWSDLDRVCEMLRAEISRYFFVRLARSRDDMVLFRHDQARLLQVRFFLRQLAELNRVVLAAIDNPRTPVGVNERETGLPDRLFWSDECRGNLDGEVYHIRRTLSHNNVPNLLITDGDKINRHCFADIRISGRGGRSLCVEKTYPLTIWPTGDDVLKEYAESVRRMNNN